MAEIDDRQLAVYLLSKFFYPLHENRKQYEDSWVTLRKRYIGYLEESSDEEEDWRAKLPDFLTFAFVQSMVAYMYEAFFGVKPYISVEIYEGHQIESEEERTRKLIEAALNKQFDEAQVAGKKGIMLFADAFLYGTSIARVFWRTEKKKRYYLANGEKKEREYTIYDGPDIKPISLFDFWIDPFTTLDQAKVVIVRNIINYDEFLALQESGYYRQVELASRRSTTSEEYQESKALFIRADESPVYQTDPDLVEILEIWIKGYGGELGKVYHIANREVVVREEENPFWSQELPFISFTPVPDSGKFYGLSAMWIARGAIDELITHKRLRLDNIKLSLYPMWKARGNVNPEDLQVKMNGVIWCDTRADDVEPLRVPYASIGVAEEEQLLRDIMFITGFNEIMAGSIPRTSIFRTSLGASVFSQLAFGRLGLMKLSLAEDISKLAYRFLEMDYQYLSNPIVVELFEPDGEKFVKIKMEVTPEILTRANKLVPIASLDPNRQIRKQQFLNLIQVASALPQLAARLNEEAIWKELCYDFNFQNREILLLKPPQAVMPQIQQTALQQQQQTTVPEESDMIKELMRQIIQGGGLGEE